MKNSFRFFAAVLVLALASSCTQMQPVDKETVPDARVVLAKKNYKVLATQVRGEDTGFALLTGIQSFFRILSVIPFFNATNLPSGITIDAVSEAKALDNLYKNAGALNTGRATQLINVRKEIGGFNVLLFGRPKIRYTADLIEFYTPGADISQSQNTQEAVSETKDDKKTVTKRRRRR